MPAFLQMWRLFKAERHPQVSLGISAETSRRDLALGQIRCLFVYSFTFHWGIHQTSVLLLCVRPRAKLSSFGMSRGPECWRQ